MIFDEDFEIGGDGRVPLSGRQHEQVLNVCQDIMSSMSSIPTPKHVGMALHVIKQTRSKETVTLLNRFGNSISYYDAQRYITSMALSAEQRQRDNGFFIPDNIRPGLFTHFAFDNLDFQESSLDGKTTHGTTHIIYQCQPDQPSLSEANTTMSVMLPLCKPRKLSLDSVEPFQTRSSMLTLTDRREGRSLRGMRLAPDRSSNDSNRSNDFDFIFNLCQGGSTNLLEFVSEPIPMNWNQFNEALLKDEVEKTLIGYGPFFPESPTNPDVVLESLNYCIGVAQKLQQDFCIVTCDQAIYEIVLALKNKNPDRYKKVIVRMGGFHIAMNFLSAVGFFMKETGIEDILVESGVCQAGTVNKILNGKDYYAMVHAHTIVESNFWIAMGFVRNMDP